MKKFAKFCPFWKKSVFGASLKGENFFFLNRLIVGKERPENVQKVLIIWTGAQNFEKWYFGNHKYYTHETYHKFSKTLLLA